MARKFLTPIDLSNLELRNFAVQNLTSAPATIKGALYFDSNSGINNLKYYDGSSWLTISTSAGTVTAVTGSSPVVSSGGTTPQISLASGYGDTQNPYGNKTQNWVLAASASNSTSTPTFRALVAGDIPTSLNGTTFGGNVAMGGFKITGLADPTAADGAATKNYVDNVAQGVNVHDAVVGLISTQITGTYAIGSTTANPPGDGGTGVGATITYSSTGVITSSDSTSPVTFAAGDRVLVTGGVSSGPATWTPAIANGIYVVTTAGAVGTAAVLTRSTDADNSIFGDLAAGDLIYVTSGGTYSGTQWVQTTKGTATTGSGASLRYSVKIGTDSIAYTQFSGNGAIPFATTSTAGIASFSSTYFSVSGTGAVSLSSLGSLNTTGSAGSATTAGKWTSPVNLAGNSVDGSTSVAFANKFIVQGTTDTGLTGAQFLGALSTGILKNTTSTGVLSIAVAADFPTLNQNTTGSAATLTTSRNLWGQSFNGSADVTGAMTGVTSITGTASSTLTISQASKSSGTGDGITISAGAVTNATGTGGAINIYGGDDTTGTATSAFGGSVTIRGGNSNTTKGTGGFVYIRGGAGEAAQVFGSQGQVVIGDTTTSQVTIGNSGNTTQINGTVYMPNVAPVSGTTFVKVTSVLGTLSNAALAYSDLPTGSQTRVSRTVYGSVTLSGTNTITANHALGSRYVNAQLFDSTYALVEVDVVLTDANNVTFTFAANQSATYNWVITG